MIFTFLSSYNSETLSCYTSHDSEVTRDSPFGLYGLNSAGYNSYFMVDDSAFSDFTTLSSIDDQIWWKGSSGERAQNTDIDGMLSAAECYDICLLATSGLCWVFRWACTCKSNIT